ncbi:MAG: hypothetical protein QOI54_1575 [Actinomycetota bacterium]|nr:hypothetical protein [Actinomycetota bacterium]
MTSSTLAQATSDTGSSTGVATTVLALVSAGALAAVGLVGASQLSRSVGGPLDIGGDGALRSPGSVLVTPRPVEPLIGTRREGSGRAGSPAPGVFSASLPGLTTDLQPASGAAGTGTATGGASDPAVRPAPVPAPGSAPAPAPASVAPPPAPQTVVSPQPVPAALKPPVVPPAPARAFSSSGKGSAELRTFCFTWAGTLDAADHLRADCAEIVSEGQHDGSRRSRGGSGGNGEDSGHRGWTRTEHTAERESRAPANGRRKDPAPGRVQVAAVPVAPVAPAPPTADSARPDQGDQDGYAGAGGRDESGEDHGGGPGGDDHAGDDHSGDDHGGGGPGSDDHTGGPGGDDHGGDDHGGS